MVGSVISEYVEFEMSVRHPVGEDCNYAYQIICAQHQQQQWMLVKKLTGFCMSGIRAWSSNIPISALSMQQVYCGLWPRIQRHDKYQYGHQHANSVTWETQILDFW